jgi:hypothetical protein
MTRRGSPAYGYSESSRGKYDVFESLAEFSLQVPQELKEDIKKRMENPNRSFWNGCFIASLLFL